tara:strand:- start:1131 stop:1358 length:228 start_codon:yes stop_codon:yes gene_type:complete
MRKVFLIIIVVILGTSNVFALTLKEALIQTYKHNTELNAERENIKVSKKDLRISKGDYLPSASLLDQRAKRKPIS